MKTKEKKLILFYFWMDLILLNLSLILVGFVYMNKHKPFDFINYALLLNLSWIIIFFLYPKRNLFLRDGFTNRLKQQVIRFCLYASLVSFVLLFLNHLSFIILFGTILLFFSFNINAFFAIYTYLGYKRRQGRHVRKVLVAGYNLGSEEINCYLNDNPELGYKIIGYVDFKDNLNAKFNYLGDLNSFQSIYDRFSFEEVLIALPVTLKSEIDKLVKLSEFNGVRIRLIPDYYSLLKKNVKINQIGNVPLVDVHSVPLDKFNSRFLKRIFDIIFSFSVIVLVLPLMTIVALAIKLESRGSVFYKPVRIGKNGKEFSVLKFRSMRNSDSVYGGVKSTIKGDPRITKVGAFIRKTNLDELPQFINVLRGEMSVIGPRPHRVNLNKDLQRKMSEYMTRSYIKPGITGWAQVNGWRGPTETRLQYNGRTLHDIWYIENWSFLLDIYIVYLTLFGKKVRKNAF
ncbi:exopolysaccharide biosynthesis polyprenyl glycosylphosphotransferase [Marinifilum sp.]|uniref:exopolysaccharide biosynthesis polyprenyl glycosylphosphotransferase n=1 Tax=Marinifilum sp. TaxID=2033137 RepID=UPI003BA9D945